VRAAANMRGRENSDGSDGTGDGFQETWFHA
jgi:hypothetical protein